jgi:hypothetical protein
LNCYALDVLEPDQDKPFSLKESKMETEANYYVRLLHFLFLELRWTCTYAWYLHLLEWALLEWWLCELQYPGNVKFGLRHPGFVLKWNILSFRESLQNILD